ncbi:MAG: glycosyltransferase family 4 protein [Phycisphaerales bacterium]|nr:glycosyltransferase family 4 protein [Phycisphaerales bacterium]MCB9854170.1 glycosyltransferase family 4 protein [Phycisphaerales bacterium]MCB9864694.1 glycosyltransferase family 4 protein [Phycisphaerales bacterium]
MKYLIAVDDCFIDRPGGMGRVAWDMALIMRDAGHDVAMFSARLDRGPAETQWDETDGIRILRYNRPVISRFDPFRMRKGVAAARRAAEALKNESWDLVHSHSPYSGIAAFDALAGCQPLVATVHSPVTMEQQINWSTAGVVGKLKGLLATGPLRRLEYRLLAQCNGIHVLSQYTRRQLIRLHNLAHDAVIIPHWRRPELRRTKTRREARIKLGWPLDTPILFTVRGHVPRTGIEIAIRAIGPLAKAGRCMFMIGGDGVLRPYHEKLVADLGIGERLRFCGRMSDENLILAYEAADCFILPTLSLECFGIIIIEALAFGCPVISTDAAAIPETMESILPDCIVPAGNIDALRHKVDEFLGHHLAIPSPDELTAYVRNRYDEDVIRPVVLRFLESAAGR